MKNRSKPSRPQMPYPSARYFVPQGYYTLPPADDFQGLKRYHNIPPWYVPNEQSSSSVRPVFLTMYVMAVNVGFTYIGLCCMRK